jgi:TIR domain
MSDAFISYCAADEQLARFMHRHLIQEGLTAFLAPVSLAPGQRWPSATITALKASNWVLFLASRAACASPWVQQEIGLALATNKKLIPIVWDMPPSQLPGWAGQFQALNLAGATSSQVNERMSAICEQIKSDKVQGLLIAGLLIAGLIALGIVLSSGPSAPKA